MFHRSARGRLTFAANAFAGVVLPLTKDGGDDVYRQTIVDRRR